MYLLRLFRHSKLGFTLAVLFIVGQILATRFEREITPFFNWGMYSQRVEAAVTYFTPHVWITGAHRHMIDLTECTDLERQLISQPLTNWYRLNYSITGSLDGKQQTDPLSDIIRQEWDGKVPPRLLQRTLEEAVNRTEVLGKFEPWLQTRLSLRSDDTLSVKATWLVYDDENRVIKETLN